MQIKTKIMGDSKFVEIKTVWSDVEANELLSKGWELIHGGFAHLDSRGLNAKTCFIMGKTNPPRDGEKE